jgi:hypothetical protein
MASSLLPQPGLVNENRVIDPVLTRAIQFLSDHRHGRARSGHPYFQFEAKRG